MNRWLRRTGLLSIAVAALGVPALTGFTSLTDAGAAVPQAQQAAPASAEVQFSSCLRGTHHGDVLLLIDESGSIANTDGGAARVTAAEYLIGQLNRNASAGAVQLSVSVAAFADTYRKVLGWTKLTSGAVGSVDGALESLRPAHQGYDTDYWTALNASRRALETRAGADSSSCQAIIWFTDGELDIEPRTSGSPYSLTKPYARGVKITSKGAAMTAQRAAQSDLCRTAGLADLLRTDRIRTFAIGLQAPGTHPDFDLLTRIATGFGRAGRCGVITSPAPGSFHLVSGIDSLLFAFDAIASPGGGSSSQTGICQKTVTDPSCARDRHTFVLDGSIKTVHVLATSTITKARVTLQSPNGKSIDLTDHGVGRQSTASAGPVSASYTWASPQTLSIDMTQPTSGAGWTGEWALVFTDPTRSSPNGKSISDIHISSDISATWPDAKAHTLRAGDRVTGVRLGLVRGNGQHVSAGSILGTITLSATLLDANGTTVGTVASGLTNTDLENPLTLDLTKAQPGPAALRLNLAITTRGATVNGHTIPGTPLTAEVTDVPLNLAAPLNYPKITPPLAFGAVTGAAHRTGHIAVSGNGCVWLDAQAPILAEPADVGTVRVTSAHRSQGTCQKVSGSESLDATITTAREGYGSLKGTVTVWSVPSNGTGRPIPVTIGYSLNMQTDLKVWHFAIALVIALVLGPGIPILLLYLAKWFAARIPPGTVLAERFPVTVTPEDVIRDGLPLSLRDRDFVDHAAVIGGRGARRVSVLGVTLRAVVTKAPGKACEVVVEAHGLIGASSSPSLANDRSLRARLPLAVQNSWVLLHDPLGAAESAEILVLVGPDTPPDRRAELIEQARQRIPAMLTTLRAAARDKGIAVSDARQPAHAGFDGGFADGPNPFAATAQDFGGGGFPDDEGFPDHGRHSASPAFGRPGPGPSSIGTPSVGPLPDDTTSTPPAQPTSHGPASSGLPDGMPGPPPADDFGFDDGTGFPDGGSYPDHGGFPPPGKRS